MQPLLSSGTGPMATVFQRCADNSLKNKTRLNNQIIFEIIIYLIMPERLEKGSTFLSNAFAYNFLGFSGVRNPEYLLVMEFLPLNT